MREVMDKVYVTTDGKKFLDKEEAELHEEYLERTKYYKVCYNPDLTETGNLTREGYIVVTASWSHELWVEDYMYKHYGKRVQFVQGVAPTVGWTIEEVGYVNDSEIIAKIQK